VRGTFAKSIIPIVLRVIRRTSIPKLLQVTSLIVISVGVTWLCKRAGRRHWRAGVENPVLRLVGSNNSLIVSNAYFGDSELATTAHKDVPDRGVPSLRVLNVQRKLSSYKQSCKTILLTIPVLLATSSPRAFVERIVMELHLVSQCSKLYNNHSLELSVQDHSRPSDTTDFL
jgi:hypothetical protein